MGWSVQGHKIQAKKNPTAHKKKPTNLYMYGTRAAV